MDSSELLDQSSSPAQLRNSWLFWERYELNFRHFCRKLVKKKVCKPVLLHYHNVIKAWLIKAIKQARPRTVLEHNKREREREAVGCGAVLITVAASGVAPGPSSRVFPGAHGGSFPIPAPPRALYPPRPAPLHPTPMRYPAGVTFYSTGIQIFR